METPKRDLRSSQHTNVQDGNTPFKVPASPLLKTLGYGSGVSVYYLERSPRPTGQLRSPWAIKRVSSRTRVASKESCKLFNERIVKEAEILRHLNHPNIVGFRAITRENADIDILALECCTSSLGLLLENRFEQNLGALPPYHIKKMILDISNALHYLHTEAKILHGDLKSHNVLVKDDFEVCKLCDFGVSLPLDAEGVVNFKENPHLRYVGTYVWCAPEVISEEDIIDSKAEMFSFGLVIYETIALVPPHTLNLIESEISENEDSILNSDSNVFEEMGDNTPIEMAYGTRPPLPQVFDLTDDYNFIMELFYLCTNTSADDRPSAKAVYDSLAKEMESK